MYVTLNKSMASSQNKLLFNTHSIACDMTNLGMDTWFVDVAHNS